MATAVLKIFEQHGLHHHDVRHTSRAIALVREASLVYDAQLESPTEPAKRGGLTCSQLQLLHEMCENAQVCVTAGIETCRACDHGLCLNHAYALAQAASYRAFAVELGARPTPLCLTT
jgi:hypothetical protein